MGDIEYLAMVKDIEGNIPSKELSEDSELRQLAASREEIKVIQLGRGLRLIVRDESEILVPKSARNRMMQNLHLVHSGPESMMFQAKKKFFWPGLKKDLQDYYEQCEECRIYKKSKANARNEVSFENLFDIMEPGTLVEVDYCDFKSESYLVMADSVSGFIQTYRTSGKTCKEAVRCIREWGSNFGKPYILKTDFGPSYRDSFRKECWDLGIEVIHSSSYNSQSQGLVERAAQSVKNLLKKSSGKLTQLELSEMVFALNAKESEMGSNLSRFIGRGLRTHIPNSLDRSVNFRELIKERRLAREKRVRKKQRTEQKKLIVEPGEEVWIQCPKTNLWNIKGEIVSPRTAADGTILSYEVEISIPGKGSYRSTRHRRFMRKYNLPDSDSDSAVSDNSLRLGSDDIEIADSRADIRMNGSGSNISPKTADRMVTRSYKKKQLMTAKKIGIGSLPDSDHKVQNEEGSNTEITVSAESSHVGRQSWSGVTNSHYKGLGERGSIGIMALNTCKKVCQYLHIGYSIFATLVIIILGVCLGMRSDQSMFTEAGTDGSGKAPMLSSENLNVGIVSWSNINEEVDEEEVCQCPEAGAG